MTNVVLLKDIIKASGYKMSHLAKCCGITYQAFFNRLQGKQEFRVDEMRALSDVLNLTDEDTKKIFFAK